MTVPQPVAFCSNSVLQQFDMPLHNFAVLSAPSCIEMASFFVFWFRSDGPTYITHFLHGSSFST